MSMFNGQNQNQGPAPFVPKTKNFNKNSQRYEKKEKSPSNKTKKEKTGGEKKYSPKQKEAEVPAAEKAQEWAWWSSSNGEWMTKTWIELKNLTIRMQLFFGNICKRTLKSLSESWILQISKI